MNVYQYYQQLKAKVSVSSEAGLCWSESRMALPSVMLSPGAVPSTCSPFGDAKGCVFPCPVVLLGSLNKSNPAKVFVQTLRSKPYPQVVEMLPGEKKKRKKGRKKEEKFSVSGNCVASIGP